MREKQRSLDDVRRRLARLPRQGSIRLQNVTPDWIGTFFAVKGVSSKRLNEWGRGTTLEAARMGALMERVERLSAFLAVEQAELRTIIPANFRGRVLSLASLGLTNLQRYLGLEEAESVLKNDFLPVRRLGRPGSALAPASRILLRHRSLIRDASCSTGLASHFSLEEAIWRGFLEVLERHVHHLLHYGGLRPSMEVRCEPAGISSPGLRSLVEELTGLRFSLRVWALPVSEDLYSFAVLLDHPSDRPREVSVNTRLNVSIHPDPETALERGLTESLLCRAAFHWKPRRTRGQTTPVLNWKARRSRSIRDLPVKPRDDGPRAVARIAQSLGVEAYWADLTHHTLRIPVVRVLVPGLQPNFDLLGLSPLDPRSRITPWLKQFPQWLRQVRGGEFSGEWPGLPGLQGRELS